MWYEHPRLVLDEIHKYPRWKRFLKGFFDEHAGALEILVTGCVRVLPATWLFAET